MTHVLACVAAEAAAVTDAEATEMAIVRQAAAGTLQSLAEVAVALGGVAARRGEPSALPPHRSKELADEARALQRALLALAVPVQMLSDATAASLLPEVDGERPLGPTQAHVHP